MVQDFSLSCRALFSTPAVQQGWARAGALHCSSAQREASPALAGAVGAEPVWIRGGQGGHSVPVTLFTPQIPLSEHYFILLGSSK